MNQKHQIGFTLEQQACIDKYGSIVLRICIGNLVCTNKIDYATLATIASDTIENIQSFINGNPSYSIHKKILIANHFQMDKNALIDFRESEISGLTFDSHYKTIRGVELKSK